MVQNNHSACSKKFMRHRAGNCLDNFFFATHLQERRPMRTTLNIADDVLNAAIQFSRQEKKSVGQIISELARTGLAASEYQAACQPGSVYGFRPFPKAGRIVSNALINRLRDGGEY